MEHASQPSLSDFARKRAWSVVQCLLLPVLLMAFYLAAPHWLERQVHAKVAGEIGDSKLPVWKKEERLSFFSRVSFERAAEEPPPYGLEELHRNLARNGIAARFHRIEWGERLSVALVVFLCAAILALYLLDERARQRPRELPGLYRAGWRIGMAVSFVGLAAIAPLLAYGVYEFTALLLHKVPVNLVLLCLIGGVSALFLGITALRRRVPLEVLQADAREVPPEEAPEAWDSIRRASERLGTPPPDHLLVGLGYGFHVTELAVRLASGKRLEGKTLYLSYPLLRRLDPEEALAVVGHEMGHFAGADTAMMREFYPFRHKVQATMRAMARGGFAAIPVLLFLRFFVLCFEGTIQRLFRAREHEADRAGAALTSPEVMARALVKVHVLIEAVQAAAKDGVHLRGLDPLGTGLHELAASRLVPDPAFWSRLFEKALAHPFDSHPPLRLRLADLGADPESPCIRTLAPEGESAFARLFPGAEREALFSGLSESVEKNLAALRVATAHEAGTQAERAELEQLFPPVVWNGKGSGVLIVLGVVVLLGAIPFVALVMQDPHDRTMAARAGAAGVFIAASAGFFFAARRQGRRRLTLDSRGLSETRGEPILFRDIGGITAGVASGGPVLVLHYITPREKKTFGLTARRDREIVSLRNWKGKPREIAETIDRYYRKRIA